MFAVCINIRPSLYRNWWEIVHPTAISRIALFKLRWQKRFEQRAFLFNNVFHSLLLCEVRSIIRHKTFFIRSNALSRSNICAISIHVAWAQPTDFVDWYSTPPSWQLRGTPANMTDRYQEPISPSHSNLNEMGLSMRASSRAVNAANIASPPGSKTPPSMSSRKTISFPNPSVGQSKPRIESEAIDPDALATALKEYEEAGRRRDRTPGSSPSRKRQRVYGDRYGISLWLYTLFCVHW